MIQIMINGGWMMIPIILSFIVGVIVIIERSHFFLKQRSPVQPPQIMALMEKGKFADALALIDRHPTPAYRILAVGITNRLGNPSNAMLVAGMAENASMKRGFPVLDTVITLGPLLGLLGTIIGMIDSFGIMADQGMGQPHAVTGGVAEALICTASGIFVAISVLAPYNFFLSCVEHEQEQIQHWTSCAENFLASNEDSIHMANNDSLAKRI